MTPGNSQPSASEVQELDFENAFQRLTEIAERLEAGGLTLAEATAQYEQGMKLVQRCNHLLDTAELEITTLRESYQRPPASPGRHEDSEPPYFDDALYDELPEDEDAPSY